MLLVLCVPGSSSVKGEDGALFWPKERLQQAVCPVRNPQGVEEASPSSAPQPHTVRVGIVLDLQGLQGYRGCSSLLAILGEGRQQQLSGPKQKGTPRICLRVWNGMDSYGQQRVPFLVISVHYEENLGPKQAC